MKHKRKLTVPIGVLFGGLILTGAIRAAPPTYEFAATDRGASIPRCERPQVAE